MKQVDWAIEIVELAKQQGISLRELAADFDISHVYLGKVVRGEKPASARLKIKIWERQESTLDDLTMLELLLPDDVAADFARFRQTRAARQPKK